MPASELCNGADDDCDGQVDEDFALGTACDGPDSDQCAEGKVVCAADGSAACGDTTGDTVELCNLSDDDCDGEVDEGFRTGEACDGKDSDLCAEGEFVCNASGVAVCSDVTSNTVERCNGADDDCDGQTDEDFALGTACDGPDSDQCAEGQVVCAADGSTTCGDTTGDSVELCNLSDDDCDGEVDEGFRTGEACDGADSDLCAEGQFVCNASGTAVCSDITNNSVERCNGVDDDCDGQVDEDFALGTACDGPDSDQCAEGQVVCAADGSTTCGDTTGDSLELCNQSDDDCDGQVDEDFDLMTDPVHCGRCETACGASETCVSGACVQPVETNCADSLDNDGDARVDCADPDCASQSCGTGCLCQAGVRTESVCNDQLDNDRDARTDCLDPDCATAPACKTLRSLAVTPGNVQLVAQGSTGAVQAFTVTGTYSDGSTQDLTGQAAFSVDDTRLGSFLGASFTSSTTVGGTSTVRARVGSLSASSSLTVKLAQRVTDASSTSLPSQPETRFGGNVDAVRKPQIVYPSSGTLLPPNLEQVEIHFLPGPAANTLFELAFTNDVTDVRVYLRCYVPTGFTLPAGVSRGCVYTPTPDVWRLVTESNRGGQPVRLVLRGTDDSGTSTVGVSEPISLQFSRSGVGGELTWFTTAGGIGLMRYDFSDPSQRTASPLFRASNISNGGVACVGCHTVSRNGRKMVVEVNGQNDGRLALVDLSTLTSSTRVPLAQGATKLSSFQSWNADGSRFVGVYADVGATSYNLRLFNGDTAALVGDIPNTGTSLHPATHPDWSADGQMIAYMSMGIAGTNQRGYKGSIQVVTAQPGGAWSDPVTVVPSQSGKNRYAPAIAPDSSFLVYDESTCSTTSETHFTCNSDSDPSARLWAAPLHVSAAPVELARANAPGFMDGATVDLTNSYPRWNPSVARGVPGSARIMWVVFASTRMYGLRTPASSTSSENLRNALLWVAAVDPDKLLAGEEPSFPAFALPFQDLSASNHLPQWTGYGVSNGCSTYGEGCGTGGGTCCNGLQCVQPNADPPQPCDVSGACVCQPIPQCAPEAAACSAAAPCCDGLRCLDDASGADCTGGNCSCRPACSGTGQGCGDTRPCCDGLLCGSASSGGNVCRLAP